ncbi:MAG: peptidylprolyl isomerase [Flavobacteriaceae bacterium]|nr:peptidylprolyl isomerase [Flavobacteriaceae bacterium]
MKSKLFLFLMGFLFISVNSKVFAQSKTPIISNTNTIPFLKAYGAKNTAYIFKVDTKFGSFTMRLYKDTPLYRASFVYLTKMGYFETAQVDRISPGFIIQAGDSDDAASVNMRYKFKNYLLPAHFLHKHKQYAVAAARSWDNNPKKLSSPFEFYIVLNKRGAHHLDKEHTVFGEVISGFEVIKKIEVQKAGRDEWPIQDIAIKVKIIK